MPKRKLSSSWARTLQRSVIALTRAAVKASVKAAPLSTRSEPGKPGKGDWIAGMAITAAGARRYRLYRPANVRFDERLPLVVMLHGCGQTAMSFAQSTRMNRIAERERFLVLYPEQDRLANAQRCWNWFDTTNGRAYAEAELIMQAVNQVCLLYRADSSRMAVAGLSAGASMAALLVTRHPARFKALMMHSGIPPGAAHSTLSAAAAMRGRRTVLPLIATPPAVAASWPPIMVIHGCADHVVSAANAEAAVQVWANAAGANRSDAQVTRRGKRYPMTVTHFKARKTTVAKLVQVQQLGHAWSGGAANQPYSDVAGPDASRMLWAFANQNFAMSGH